MLEAEEREVFGDGDVMMTAKRKTRDAGGYSPHGEQQPTKEM